jgi:oleate hydratase
MRAHIVGGGFGGLAAAALLIRNAGVSGADITIYEAEERLGGGFFLGGSAKSGYNLPGSVFDKEFRCTFDLLKSIPSASNPSISVTEEFFAFNKGEPYHDRAHIFDRNGRIIHGPHFGLSLRDGFDLVRLLLTPEAMLDGRRIEEFFSPKFFSTEFWLLWSTIMGSLPQHSAIEFRRYMNRFLYLFGDLSDMTGVMRTPINQHQAFIEPLVAWLRARGVNFLTGAFVQDIGFAPSPGRITVDRLDYERGGAATSVAVAPEDPVLVTTGSQAADLSAGSMTEAPSPRLSGRSWALWARIAEGRTEFGKPNVFFGEDRVPLSRWVTFTVTTTGSAFINQMSALTGSEPGRGGLVTLKDSSWVLSLSIFHQPEVIGQPTRHERMVGLRSVSGAQWRFRAETHGSMHRGGDPGGGAAATAVRQAVGCDHGVIDLHPLRLALCEQYLAPAQPWRQAARGSQRGDKSRAHRSVCGGSQGNRLHHRMLHPLGVGSDLRPARARPRAAAPLSGSVRSEGAVQRAEGVCLSVICAVGRYRPFTSLNCAGLEERHL